MSMDLKFTGTRDEDNAKDPKDTLAISLVMVDQETKFVHVIPVPTKEATAYLVEEVCRVLMLLNSKVMLRTDTEPAMISLRKKVQGIRKLKKLETEIQDVAPDAHEGLQVERWVQTVRNLSKTLVYHAETEAKVKITSECTLYPWAARHAGFLLNRFVVQKGKTPFEVLFGREYKGKLAPWGSVVLGKQLPKVKEKGEAWRKGIFVGKDMVSNMNLVSTIQGIIKCRTMRQCTPAYDAAAMAMAAGTPWSHNQQHLVTKSKQNKRLPPTSGLEAIADGRMLPKGPQGGNGETDDYVPSEGPGPDEAGSDPPTSQEARSEGDDDDGDDGEDPGEGQRGRIRNRSDRSTSSEEMIAGEEQPTSQMKRNLEGQAEESENVRQRIDEGTTETEERPDKFPAVRVEYVRSVSEIGSFMRKELPRYHIDEEVELDELETAVGSENEDGEFMSDGEDEVPEEIPKWSHAVEDGPPKLDESELERVDGVSRQKEIERLTEMKVLKEMPEGADVSKYKFLSTKVVYDWRHREGEWRRRGRLVAREFGWLSSYDIASLFSPTGVASTVKLLSGLFVSSDGYTLGSIDVGDAYLMGEQDEPTVVEVGGRYYQLGYTLPGQRIGSSAWFGKLKGYLEEFGLKSDDGLPALFFKRPEKGQKRMIVLSHVDDMELCIKRRVS